MILIQGCGGVETKTISIYDHHTIPANTGISTGVYTSVDGYRYLNVLIEFEQKTGDEKPVSIGVIFAHKKDGALGSRRYFTFDENYSGLADPKMITVTGKGSWHGSQQKSSYIARLPIMGPYAQVFPFNHHDEARKISISFYLVE